jgi:uncharacterized repeat protein (TIGR03803 family)
MHKWKDASQSAARRWWRVSAVVVFCGATIISQGQTFTSLANLTPTTGERPGALVQGTDGNLYGAANDYGAYGGGTFFQVTPSGTVTPLYNFCFNDNPGCPDGAGPLGAVALGVDSNFYGTTEGSFFGGEVATIYKITTAGSLTTLHTFCMGTCSDGNYPTSGLSLAWNGDFYGISNPPEDSSAYDNLVYKISSSGTFTTLFTVCPNQTCPTDAGPYGTFLQASGGYLIAPGPGGTNGIGAIYRMTPAGIPTVIYSFCADGTCHDGEGPNTPLVQTAGGSLIGTNVYGGAGANCTISEGCGTAFRVLSGSLTKLHDFCSWENCTDGGTPNALIQATDGNFYGTTSVGGASKGYGTIFKLTPSGQYTVIHRFDLTDGANPAAALVQATDGNLYGTTSNGGTDSEGDEVGTIFRVSLGLPPFVKTVQNAALVGGSVIILGNNLTGSTGVTFNGRAALFSVTSDTEITATVPAGATTGPIQVITPSATLSSNVAFVVRP